METTTITFTKEELELIYEGMSNYQDASDSHTFYDEKSDEEETNEEKFFNLYNSIMNKLWGIIVSYL